MIRLRFKLDQVLQYLQDGNPISKTVVVQKWYERREFAPGRSDTVPPAQATPVDSLKVLTLSCSCKDSAGGMSGAVSLFQAYGATQGQEMTSPIDNNLAP